MSSIDKLLEQLVEPVVGSLGFEFWGLEYSGRRRNLLLRIYIDSPEGISVEDCAQVSRQLSSVLDVEDPIQGEYTLEVSSPGLDRPLYKLEHFERFVGYSIKLKLRQAFEERRNFVGLLTGVEDAEVLLQIEDEEFCFPFEMIEKARVQPQLAQLKTN